MSKNFGIFKSLKVLLHYRERLFQSVVQEVRMRYAGSVFGLGWAVVYPLLLLSLYALIYVVIFKVRPTSLSEWEYVALVFSGLVPLLAFNESLMMSVSSLASNRSLLMNTVFPAELIPVRAILAGQIPSLFAMAATLVLGYAVGRTSWQAPIVVPVIWFFLLLFVIGIGWFLSLLTLVFKDIQQFLGLLLMMLIILSPFAYPPDMVPSGLRAILYLNPLSYFVLSFQQAIAYGSWPDLAVFLPACVISLATFFGGYAFFKRAKYAFFDYV